MKTKNKLYNVIFPIWMLILFPPVILIALVGNFIIDSIVLLIALKVLSIPLAKNYKKSILSVWIFGFIADIIGAAILFTSQILPQELYDITRAVAWNPFENIYAIIYVIVATIIAGIFIYVFNRNVSFRKLDIEENKKKKISLILAIVTMPYLFFLPTQVAYYGFESQKEVQQTQAEKISEYVEMLSDTYLGDASTITKSVQMADEILGVNLDYASEPFEMMTNDLKLIVNLKNFNNIKELELEKISIMLMTISSNTNEIEFKSELKTVSYTRKDLEDKYEIVFNKENKDAVTSAILGVIDTELAGTILKVNKIIKKDNVTVLQVSYDNVELAYITIDPATTKMHFDSIEQIVEGIQVIVVLPEIIDMKYPMDVTAVEISFAK